MPENEKKTLLGRLTVEQQNRLKTLSANLRHDRITVSFSIELRDETGRKMSVFYSDTVSRKGDDPEFPSVGFSNEEVRLARVLLAKQVTAVVYEEAVAKGMMSSDQAREEFPAIRDRYDYRIVKLLEGNS